jgi:hypothetical protein
MSPEEWKLAASVMALPKAQAPEAVIIRAVHKPALSIEPM